MFNLNWFMRRADERDQRREEAERRQQLRKEAEEEEIRRQGRVEAARLRRAEAQRRYATQTSTASDDWATSPANPTSPIGLATHPFSPLSPAYDTGSSSSSCGSSSSYDSGSSSSDSGSSSSSGCD